MKDDVWSVESRAPNEWRISTGINSYGDGPALLVCIVKSSEKDAQAICDAHNLASRQSEPRMVDEASKEMLIDIEHLGVNIRQSDEKAVEELIATAMRKREEALKDLLHKWVYELAPLRAADPSVWTPAALKRDYERLVHNTHFFIGLPDQPSAEVEASKEA